MTVLPLLACAGILGLCGSTVRDVGLRPTHPAARPLVPLIGLLGALATAIALALTPVLAMGPAVRMALLAGYVFASVLWVAFAVAYTGYGPPITRRLTAGLAVLGGLAVLSSTITWLQEVGRAEFGAIGAASYVTTFVLQVAVFALGLLGAVLLARSTVESADLPARRGGVLVACGIGIAALPFTVRLGQALPTTTALVVPFVIVGGVVGAVAALQHRRDLFATVPLGGHLARDAVLEHLGDPIIVTDRRHRLLDANRAAADTFGLQRTALRRRRLPEIVGIDEDTDLADTVRVETTEGRREFAVGRSEIGGADGDRIALAYRLEDVTERRTRDQQLQVLNRVTRHNLRNDLDAIRGFAEAIRDGDREPALAAERFERIEGMATELVDLSAAIERSGRLIADADPDPARCDLVALLRSTIEDVASDGSEDATQDAERDTASAPVDVSLRAGDEPIELRTAPAILRLTVDELLDNAIEHSDRAVPTVIVDVRATDDGATIEVRDDGPGLPAYERGVLLAGEETPAAHGSGVGLWLAHWAVTRLGGTLDFEANEPRGTVARVHLSDLQGTSNPPSSAD